MTVAIALQTHVLRTCPMHGEFLLSETIAAAPVECPQCAAPAVERLT
jgi:hypothetical protein